MIRMTILLLSMLAPLGFVTACWNGGNVCGEESSRQAHLTGHTAVKYRDLFKRQPGYLAIEEGFFRDEEGQRTKTFGIIVFVEEEVNQHILPMEDRIPDHLDGVPVQVLPLEIERKAESFQDYPSNIVNPEWGVDPHYNRVYHTIGKNRYLFRRYPFSSGYNVSFSTEQSREGYEIFGIDLFVTEEVDPLTLPPMDRIPSCLEDIPVEINVIPEA